MSSNSVFQALKIWQSLFSLSSKATDDQQLLADELRRWCQVRGGFDAALYEQCEGGEYRLTVSVGPDAFPKHLGAPATTANLGWERLEAPGVVLLHRGSLETGSEIDSELVALLAGARISGLKQQIQQQKFQARFRGVELEALYEVGLAIASTLNLEELTEEVLLRAVSLLDARRGALYLFEAGRYRLSCTIAGEARAEFSPAEIDLADVAAGEGRVAESLMPGARYLLAVPVEIDRDPRGLLVLADKESRRGVGPFPTSDRQTLALFANQAAIALENAKLHRMALEKERLEREMELAVEIQRQILPKTMPRIPGFEVTGWNRPARQVGGDYFDVQKLAEGRWWLALGDVTGKGLPAALLVSTLHSALRLLFDRFEVEEAMVERLNQHILESSSVNKFITLLLGQLEVETATFKYLNAGHNPGLWVRSDERVELLESSGLPIGMLPSVQVSAASLVLGPGDLVCLYSDGITECESSQEEEFGLDRLTDLLLTRRQAPLPKIIEAIASAVTDFAEGLPQGDDQTVVLLRRQGADA